ncbi:MAG TPA: flagellar motor protein [Bryobacteraceae bacterium]|nr:flagellar motor protein [Bryobacteraceae bacterium]
MAETQKPKLGLDLATIGGVVLALAGILGGLILEGGKLRDIAQFTAGLIVLGGTCGAVLISTPLATVLAALVRLRGIFFEKSQPAGSLIEEIIQYAMKARKNGIVSLENEAAEIANPFLRKALTLAIDGTDLEELRHMMELQMDLERRRANSEVKVYESGGGYAPTIGIIGAVLGLIQVMKNLANIDEVGHGIAVAFVATVYGVGLSNIFLLPAATKLKARIAQEMEINELILQGVISIVEGLNPKLIRSKLEAFVAARPVRADNKTAQETPAAEPATQTQT